MKLADFKPAHFLWEVTDRVAVLRLNRPERKNPLTLKHASCAIVPRSGLCRGC